MKPKFRIVEVTSSPTYTYYKAQKKIGGWFGMWLDIEDYVSKQFGVHAYTFEFPTIELAMGALEKEKEKMRASTIYPIEKVIISMV